MIRFQRTFYPVGFGAFYMEVHEAKNNSMTIVYDCGTITKSVDIEKIIDEAFWGRNKVVDILFISHFHEDHISGIPYLLKNYKIKKVVIPYISKDNRMLFVLAEGVEEYQQMIVDTEGYFGEETEIVRILPERGEQQMNEQIEGMEELEHSGEALYNSFSASGWLLIPFNYNYAEKISKLKELLSLQGLKYELLTEKDYIRDNYDLIQETYKKMKGGPNITSLTLFSGVNRSYSHVFIYQNGSLGIISGPNCIYLGDVSMNSKFIKKIKTRMEPYIKSLYTVQVPHHGAKGALDSCILNPHSVAVICHKKGDSKHPSTEVVNNIKSSHSCPIFVTEDRLTEFMEFGRW